VTEKGRSLSFLLYNTNEVNKKYEVQSTELWWLIFLGAKWRVTKFSVVYSLS
jgi:hypothetical protein